MLTREEMEKVLTEWQRAWNEHDLDGVMELFHDEVIFENWTGIKIKGKNKLRRVWIPWFSEHGDFRLIEEEIFIDESRQKALFRWRLEWPSREEGFKGKDERRKGLDVLHFKDGKIIRKLTYSKTTVEIDGRWIRLAAKAP